MLPRAAFFLALLFLSFPRTAHAECEMCREGVLAVTGERRDQVLQKCGKPTWAKFYPGTTGRYRRLPVEVWVYDLGEGTFPRVLRFVDGILAEVGIESREFL